MPNLDNIHVDDLSAIIGTDRVLVHWTVFGVAFTPGLALAYPFWSQSIVLSSLYTNEMSQVG